MAFTNLTCLVKYYYIYHTPESKCALIIYQKLTIMYNSNYLPIQ